MKLIDQVVLHNFFGKGIIVAQDSDYITVQFPSKKSKFIFPDIFLSFLKCENGDLQKQIESACAEKKKAEERKKQEEREEKRKAEEEAKQRIEAKKHPRVATPDRYANENNLAFKCNFCDGGSSAICLGYKGICSDKQIWYNIEKKKRAWCCDQEGSFCYKYYSGLITRVELEEHHNTKPLCYESRMLIEWKAEAGEDRNGIDGPKARRITNASQNSLAILTTELPDIEGGKERVIFGAFITGVVDEGDDLQAGYVKALADYHIELSPDEAKKMKFWHYHKNPRNPAVVQWGMGLYRYMKDATCARILKDILAIKEDVSERAHIQTMLEYYCKIKNLDIDNIPEADGAI